MCLIYIYIYPSEHYGLSFLDLTDAIYFFTRSLFFVYISIFASTLIYMHVCYVFNVNLTDSFDDRRSQCHLI